MLVISSREFRENQAGYFDRADQGEEILVHRRKNRAYRIVPVTEDDTVMSKANFLDKMDPSSEQDNQGQRYAMNDGESLADFLDRVAADLQD